MATPEQKQELIDTLKFTPVRARILIQGYGGECYIGSVPRETYEFFKAKRIDVEQFVNDWDNELFPDVPGQHRFVESGSPYDCDNLFHQSGATMDDSSRLTVVNDDTNEDIFETDLSVHNLEDQGITVDCTDDFDSSDLETGSVIFWGGQGEKGCFFDGEITLRAPFDPAKLRITYGNGDDWYLCSGVEYDGEEVEGSDGYSTTGKWGEHKFWIAGGEEVYAGEERDEDSEEWNPAAELDKIEVPVLEGEEMWAQRAIDESSLSPWHDRDSNPVHKGEYEVVYNAQWPNSGQGRAEWTGRTWKQGGRKIVIRQWRGLNYNPAE